MGCNIYILEAIRRIEEVFGKLDKKSVPMVAKDHPELDSTTVLNDDDHKKYQMLIGMLNWIVTLGRIDICYAVSSLARFVACPRKGHMERALQVFGYLKKKPNRRIIIDSKSPRIKENGAEINASVDLATAMKEFYPDAKETKDSNLPTPLYEEMDITTFVDSDHAHDKITRQSITGLIIFVGRAPVTYLSKRQGAIETSTYGTEFMVMKTAVKEVISIRYMLRCIGVNVSKHTNVVGDNKSVIINSTISSSLLRKNACCNFIPFG